jgi:hypothetical protein
MDDKIIAIFCLCDDLLKAMHHHIGKYLGCLGQLDSVIVPKEGFEPQLGASCCSSSLGMRALRMTRQIRDGRLQRGIEPAHVPGLYSLNNLASDMPSTHGDLACRHGHLRQDLGHIGQKPLERRRGNGSPDEPLDNGGIGRVKGMQIGIGFPFFQQQFHLPDIMPP